MIDINKHRQFMLRILKDIYSDLELANMLGFKGGTAMMFFHGLPRFSVDLDFNLLKDGEEELVFNKVRKVLLKYGRIHDEALKHHGPIVVLDYGIDERKLKVEISNRKFDDHYEILNLLGINTRIMVKEDMCAHKLCALLDRETMANRDVFDSWYFLQKSTAINTIIVEQRMNMPWSDYLDKLIKTLEKKSPKGILDGIGELLDPEMKSFVKNKLLNELIHLLRLCREYPL